MASRPTAKARAAVPPLPRSGSLRRLSLARLAPSWRSLAVGVAIAVLAAGGYFAARESSLFAIRSIEVRGAGPALAGGVSAALEPLLGVNLLKLDGSAVQRLAGALPDVASVRVDRAFPHALRVTVVLERPLAIVRQGPAAWLVSAHGKVLRRIWRPGKSALPRIWVRHDVTVAVGLALGGAPAAAVAALAPLASLGFPARVHFVRSGEGELTFVLDAGYELRLGDTSDLLLKLAIARRILLAEGIGAGYLDVSVPERPVSASDPKV